MSSMHLVKRLSRGLASSIFKLSLLMLVVTTALVLTFGMPDKLKASLTDSGIYDHVVESAFESMREGRGGEDTSETGVPLSSQAIQTAAKKAFPPKTLRDSIDEIIDGIYGWLDGKTAQPEFRVDLTGAKKTLAVAIADQAVDRVQKLPVCTPAEFSRLDPNDIDPFNLPCRPPGLDPKAERKRYSAEIMASDDFLKDTVITAEDLQSEGNDPFKNAEGVPRAFQWAGRLPWIFGVTVLLSGAAVVLLHDDRRRGLKVLARTMLLTGLLLLAGSLLTEVILNRVNLGEGLTSTEGLRNALVAVIESLSASVNRVLIIFAALYTVIGGGGLIGLRMTATKNRHNSDSEESGQQTPDKPEPKKEPSDSQSDSTSDVGKKPV